MAHILFNEAYRQTNQVEHTDGLVFPANATSLPIFVGANARPCKEVQIDRVIDDFIARGDVENLVLLVPTARRVRMVQQQIVRRIYEKKGRPSAEPLVFTLERFVRHCYKRLCNTRRRRELSEAYRLALFEEAVEKAELKFFSRGGGKISPATLERLEAIVTGLKKDGIMPGDLRQDVEMALRGELEADVLRLSDIAEIYEQYQKLLGDKFLDQWEMLTLTTEVLFGERDCETLEKVPFPRHSMEEICSRVKRIFPEGSMIFAEGFSEFREPELKFLSVFTNCQIPVAVRIDFSENNGPLFGNMHDTIEKLRDHGYGDCCLDDPKPLPIPHEDPRVSVPLGAYIRRWLFNVQREIRHPGFSNVGMVIAAETRVEEVRAIAKLIKKLSQEDGIALSEISVVMRRSERYTGLFREMFALYDIPSNITDRYPLAKSPVVIAVFAVLDMVLRGFRREDVHRAMQSPYLKFSRSAIKEGMTTEIPLDGPNLYDVALQLRIVGGDRRGGKNAWLRRMQSAVESYERRIAMMEADPYADPVELSSAKNTAAAIHSAIGDFNALCDLIPEKRKMTASEFAEIVKNTLLRGLKVRESILEFHEQIKNYTKENPLDYVRLQEEVEKDARAYSAIVKLLDEMCFIYDERGQTHEKSLEEFTQRLRTAVSGARYQVREKAGLGVTVTAIEQTRGIPYTVTILCGAVDGEFPAVYTPETFLGKELPESEERFIRAERMQFYQFLTNNVKALEDGTKKLVISYPKMTESGNEIIRSPFVDALLKVTSLEFDECVFDGQELCRAGAATENYSQRRKDFHGWYVSLGSREEVLANLGNARYWEQREKKDSAALRKLLSGLDDGHFSSAADYINAMVGRRFGEDQTETGSISLEDIPAAGKDFLGNIPSRAFSVSDLERFAKCGFQYFSGKILLMNERLASDAALSPVERGTLFHAVLEKFYRRLQREQLQRGETKIIAEPLSGELPPLAPVHLDASQYEEYKKILSDLALDEFEKISYEHPFFELEKEELLGTEERMGKLELWLSEELKRADKFAFAPVLFELGFGTNSREKLSPPVELADGLRLRGRIDRIELWQDESGSWKFLITDYKTSTASVPRPKDLKDGVAYQVPLYLAAAQKFLRDNYGIEAEPAGGIYQVLSPQFDKKKKAYDSYRQFLVPKEDFHAIGQKSSRSWAPESGEELGNIIEQVNFAANDNIRRMSEGSFPAMPHSPAHCSYCSYSAVCRIRERAYDEPSGGEERTEE